MRTWKESAKTTIEVNNQEYEVEVTGTFSRFKDGEDADGNRGWWVTEMDELDIDSITPEPPADDIKAVSDAIYDMDVDDWNWEGRGEPDEE